ncbi:hypothetical protein FHR81_004190 [Actinoalloteichus hoggarensis]|uniref:tRNA nuclease CdiA C-terminal domain-containing protein n=1 Tax=Actinoalloteichus hoggarensis TaxID=1470176 RepID=A0A221WA03_9PSEU|nr:hypothetical protein [Actinoalloteichus hoggarensis]ASO22453.1 hypothetical protein AHOG_24235 [Actinoalloteichus hoggarensis]MBB5923123.1 hypothetical protein [Actinoalloteichus hoggarensis]
MAGFDAVAARLRRVLSETDLAVAELSGLADELAGLAPRAAVVLRGSAVADVAAVPALIERAVAELVSARGRYQDVNRRIHAYLAVHQVGGPADAGVGAVPPVRPPVVEESSGPPGGLEPPRPLDGSRPPRPPVVSAPRRPADTVTDDPATWPGVVREPPGDGSFTPEERAVAERLARLDPVEVVRHPESAERTPDALVDGRRVEFKTLLDADPDHRRVKNTLDRTVRRGGQADEVVIDARRTSLSSADAERGVHRFLRAPGNSRKLARISIWGAIFDFEWERTD